eukprot:CAMPEP_0176096492 /NCGR_PEP_ID=MMETSP0120_2-20121206/48372_1 /TAXON_ID=160619 /ORGANISM="Kryptoperidinium foliaceum, Strain CCMP 1326" /LENGTH=185 /DNA_ID=CAMNT_0017430477 /DNA_START=23 /DNA_END=578 /DNA_ORIENTATION=-
MTPPKKSPCEASAAPTTPVARPTGAGGEDDEAADPRTPPTPPTSQDGTAHGRRQAGELNVEDAAPLAKRQRLDQKVVGIAAAHQKKGAGKGLASNVPSLSVKAKAMEKEPQGTLVEMKLGVNEDGVPLQMRDITVLTSAPQLAIPALYLQLVRVTEVRIELRCNSGLISRLGGTGTSTIAGYAVL